MASNLILGTILAGLIHGFLLSLFILGSKKNKSHGTLFLGLLIFCISFSNLLFTAEELEWINWHQFNLIFVPGYFLVPPFLYFFVKNYLEKNRKVLYIEQLLYAPFIVFLIITLIYKGRAILYSKTWQNDNALALISDFRDYYGDFILIPFILFVILTLFKAIHSYEIKKHKEPIPLQLLWLKILLIVILLSLIPWFYYTYQYWANDQVPYTPMLLIASIVIYLLGYIGIYKINILDERKEIRKALLNIRSYSTQEKTNFQNEHVATLQRILLQEKEYLNPHLSLESLSNRMQLSKSHLSRLINNEIGSSFSEYINTLRIEEAKAHLENPEFSKYTILAIGLEAGFSSKTTFNTTFKKITGLTPSQYRKKISNRFQ